MKKSIKLVVIFFVLIVACASGWYSFQNKVSVNGVFSGIPETGNTGENILSKRTLKKPEDDSVDSSPLLKNNYSKDTENVTNKKNLDLQKMPNDHADKARPVTKQATSHYGYNEGLPVISIDQQTDVPDYIKEQYDKRSEQMKIQGYVEADDYTVLSMPSEASSLQRSGSMPLEEVLASLVFKPVSVEGSGLDQGEYLGHKAGIGLIEKEHPQSMASTDLDGMALQAERGEEAPRENGEFSRYYKFPEFAFVKLTERFLPEDSQSRITPELMNADINGNYGYYLVQKGSTDQFLSMLTWVAGNRQFILEMANKGNPAAETLKQEFFDLARSIP